MKHKINDDNESDYVVIIFILLLCTECVIYICNELGADRDHYL